MTASMRQKQKDQSRARILKAAAQLFRRQGLQATGIDQIMAKAGLTAGAFYAHFKSKDHLIEEVLWSTLPISESWPPGKFLELYLSAYHRDHPEHGCPLATLGSDLARAQRGLKSRIATKLAETIAKRTGGGAEAKRRALRTLSTAVGALILARMTQNTDLSDEFLRCYE